MNELLSSDDVVRYRSGERNPRAARKIRKAVEHERTRLWELQGDDPPAKTELGREIQKRLGTVGPVADAYVRKMADTIMRGKGGEKGKPN